LCTFSTASVKNWDLTWILVPTPAADNQPWQDFAQAFAFYWAPRLSRIEFLLHGGGILHGNTRPNAGRRQSTMARLCTSLLLGAAAIEDRVSPPWRRNPPWQLEAPQRRQSTMATRRAVAPPTVVLWSSFNLELYALDLVPTCLYCSQALN
jgi:hypothetical protein